MGTLCPAGSMQVAGAAVLNSREAPPEMTGRTVL